MTDSISGFFSGSGGGVYWPQGPKTAKPTPNGETLEGVIVAIHPPEPQTDYISKEPVPGKFQIRIDLQTELRDPDIDEDDGKRTLYVKGWMTGAISDALRAANVTEPRVGARMAITLKGRAAPTRPGIEGAQQFSVVYTPGTPGAEGFFAGNGAAATPTTPTGPQNAPIPAEPPAGIDAKAWAAMPTDVRQAIANAAAGVPSF